MSELNRRDFLAGTIAAAVPAVAHSQAGPEPVNLGMIGTGIRGTFLLESVLELPGVKIKALCDVKPDRLDRAASKAARDNPATYSDFRKVLERKDIQAVFIATPPDLHVQMAIAALQAGKHVYCEKPVGPTAESVRELLRFAKGSKLVFQTGQVMRSYPWLQKTIARIHEGVVGKVVMVRAWRHASDDMNHSTPSADWFFNVKRSGDVIVEMAVHNLDVCNWIANSRPERAAGFGGALVWYNDPPGRTNMDGYTLSYEYLNGVKLSFSQVFFHPSGMQGGGQGFLVYGTEGAVDVNKATYYRREKGAKPMLLAEGSDESPQSLHFAAFFEAIRTGKTEVPGGLEVGATAALTAILGREAIYRKKMMTWREMGVEV